MVCIGCSHARYKRRIRYVSKYATRAIPRRASIARPLFRRPISRVKSDIRRRAYVSNVRRRLNDPRFRSLPSSRQSSYRSMTMSTPRRTPVRSRASPMSIQYTGRKKTPSKVISKAWSKPSGVKSMALDTTPRKAWSGVKSMTPEYQSRRSYTPGTGKYKKISESPVTRSLEAVFNAAKIE